MTQTPYVPINVKTSKGSSYNSAIKIEPFVERLKTLGFTACTINDSSWFGVPAFHSACKKNNILPIIGKEFRLKDGSVVNIYAKNKEGYNRLIKLSNHTNLRTEGFLVLGDIVSGGHLVCVLPYLDGPLTSAILHDGATEQRIGSIVKEYQSLLLIVAAQVVWLMLIRLTIIVRIMDR